MPVVDDARQRDYGAAESALWSCEQRLRNRDCGDGVGSFLCTKGLHKCKLLWDSRNIIGEDHSKDEQKLGKLNIFSLRTTADAKRAELAQFWIPATPMLCCIEPPNGFTSRRREFNVAEQIER